MFHDRRIKRRLLTRTVGGRPVQPEERLGQASTRKRADQGRLRVRSFLTLAIIAVLLLSLIPRSSQAQSGGRYYPETGHVLEAQFIEYFDRHGGVAILGFPITDGFSDPATGRFIQYTENARLEWVSDQPGGTPHAALAPLGEILAGATRTDEVQNPEGQGCRSFSGTPHTTCYAFLEFFEANGGAELFGVPVSGFIIENNRIVQYFEYFRLDWYPDAAAGQQVRVAPLGRQHFEQQGYSPSLLEPSRRGGQARYRISELRPSASVEQPSVPPDTAQRVYLVVRDQNQQPVGGAAALLIAHLPNRDRYFLMPETDTQGVSQMSLLLDGEPSGSQVNLEIWAIHQGLEAAARDSYLIR